MHFLASPRHVQTSFSFDKSFKIESREKLWSTMRKAIAQDYKQSDVDNLQDWGTKTIAKRKLYVQDEKYIVKHYALHLSRTWQSFAKRPDNCNSVPTPSAIRICAKPTSCICTIENVNKHMNLLTRVWINSLTSLIQMESQIGVHKLFKRGRHHKKKGSIC